MARLFTTGFELAGVNSAVATAQAEGLQSDLGSYGGQNTNVRSGRYAYGFGRLGGGGTFRGQQALRRFTGALATTYYGRVYINFDSPPATWARDSAVVAFEGISGDSWCVKVFAASDKTLKLGYTAQPGGVNYTILGTQVGSAFNFAYDTWYMLELAVRIGTGAVDYCEMRVDGVSIASGSSLTISENAPGGFLAGMLDGSLPVGGTPATGVIDDMALNDSTGTSQTSWPGQGKVVALIPGADDPSSGVNWTVNTTNVTTNRFDAVDNAPPVGVVFASRTATSQVINQAKDTTGLYVPTLKTYSASVASGGGGIATGDTITLVVAVGSIGNSSTTSRSVGLNVGSNAGTPPTEVTLSSGAVAAATWPTGWTFMASNPVYAPSVTLGTAPTVALRKNSSVTDAVMAASLALYVEYVPAPVKPHPVGGGGLGHKKTIDPGEIALIGQAVRRGSLWMKRQWQIGKPCFLPLPDGMT